jgi:hypothetical protein
LNSGKIQSHKKNLQQVTEKNLRSTKQQDTPNCIAYRQKLVLKQNTWKYICEAQNSNISGVHLL